MPGIPKHSVWMAQVKTLTKGWSPNLLDLLNKINNEVWLYERARSPMAKRNVALAIHERIAKFETEWKRHVHSPSARLPEPYTELDAAAVKEASIVASFHKYDRVSCIGYGVTTTKFDELWFKKQNNTVEIDKRVKYTGDQSDKADYLAKCIKMKQAIESAYTLSGANNDRTLKIFMAPEFYFRGISGAYNIKCVSEILNVIRQLTNESKFKDWLFVFGTVIAATFKDVVRCERCFKSVKQLTRVGPNTFTCPSCTAGSVREVRVGAIIDNVALIQKGGEDGFENSYTILKEYIAPLDFRRPAERLGARWASLPEPVYARDPWFPNRRIEIMGENLNALLVPGSRDKGGSPSKFADERMGGAIFTIDGIKFGLEICLDHLNARLREGSGIQIQLVPAAGASLKRFACVMHGIAFNVDGKAGTCNVRVNASGAAPKDMAEPGYLTRAAPGGGEIVVYEPQKIPYA